MSKYPALILMLASSTLLKAQDGTAEMADKFRQDGKIYVVIAVLVVIFICLLLFLVFLERRVGRLEKKIRGPESRKELKS